MSSTISFSSISSINEGNDLFEIFVCKFCLIIKFMVVRVSLCIGSLVGIILISDVQVVDRDKTVNLYLAMIESIVKHDTYILKAPCGEQNSLLSFCEYAFINFFRKYSEVLFCHIQHRISRV